MATGILLVLFLLAVQVMNLYVDYHVFFASLPLRWPYVDPTLIVIGDD